MRNILITLNDVGSVTEEMEQAFTMEWWAQYKAEVEIEEDYNEDDDETIEMFQEWINVTVANAVRCCDQVLLTEPKVIWALTEMLDDIANSF